MIHRRVLLRSALVLFLGAPVLASFAQAQYWVSYDTPTRYMALGDSIAMGYGAHPFTQGYTYQLARGGVIDNGNNLLFCPAGVSGALSADVLAHQVPQVGLFFSDTGKPYRQVITLTVGGNDAVQVLGGADPVAVIGTYAANLGAILANLSASFPEARIYVSNLWDPKLEIPGVTDLVLAMNQATATVVDSFPSATLVDLFTAFDGRRGLLLVERNGSDPLQTHPTNAGYQVITAAFEDAIAAD